MNSKTSSTEPRRLLATEPGFPTAFSEMPSPAKVLWFLGRLPDPRQPAVAVVGARAATLAGCKRAHALSAAAAGEGYAIVSGGALGIDAAAHRGALDARGVTFAVLGCGVDVVYPDRHTRLFDEIRRRGGLLSEYPPGTPPRGRQFPARNRLVAALAQVVVIVEAGQASGALSTARLARRMNRRRSEHQTMRLRHQATHNNGKDEDAAAIPTLFQRQRLRRPQPRRAVRC